MAMAGILNRKSILKKQRTTKTKNNRPLNVYALFYTKIPFPNGSNITVLTIKLNQRTGRRYAEDF